VFAWDRATHHTICRLTRVALEGPATSQGLSSLVEIVEDRLIEQFVAHSVVEGLADPVLHRLSRLR
jgi:hypothetical protein